MLSAQVAMSVEYETHPTSFCEIDHFFIDFGHSLPKILVAFATSYELVYWYH
jgi:hypothetical protein